MSKEKKILDRATVAEEALLTSVKALVKVAEGRVREAEKRVKRAKEERDRHAGERAPKRDYKAGLRKAEAALKRAKNGLRKAGKTSAAQEKGVTAARVYRAKLFQETGRVRQAIPHKKRGMYQVSFIVDDEGRRQSVTRHCKLQGGDYVTFGGARISAR